MSIGYTHTYHTHTRTHARKDWNINRKPFPTTGLVCHQTDGLQRIGASPAGYGGRRFEVNHFKQTVKCNTVQCMMSACTQRKGRTSNAFWKVLDVHRNVWKFEPYFPVYWNHQETIIWYCWWTKPPNLLCLLRAIPRFLPRNLMDRLSSVSFDLAKSLPESVQGKNWRTGTDAASDIMCIYILWWCKT